MPATHFRCCDRTMTRDELLEHVRERRNRCQWTWELLAAMLDAQARHPSAKDGSRISTTVLTNKCLRRLAFERTQPFTIDPQDLWALFRGTQFHGQLEPYAAPGSYTEARFFVHDLGTKIPAVAEALPDSAGWTPADRSFSGSPDLVDPVHGALDDYKRTKEVPRFSHVWNDHVEQLQINRWLVDHADTVEIQEPPEDWRYALDGEEYELEPSEWEIGVVGVRFTEKGECFVTYDLTSPGVRKRFVPEHEWQTLSIAYVDDRGPKRIAVTESITVPAKNGGTKKARVPSIWTDEQVEALIAERYVLARHALTEGIAPIPSGWEYQSHILCGYCPMRRVCAEHERRAE